METVGDANSVTDIINMAAISKGWNGRQLAEELGISTATAYRWLRGDSEPAEELWPSLEMRFGLHEGTFKKAKRQTLMAAYAKKKMTPRKVGQIDELRSVSELIDQIGADIGRLSISGEIDIPFSDTIHWVAGLSEPPPEYWSRIEAAFSLPHGTFQSLKRKEEAAHADKLAVTQPTKQFHIDPDGIAASGDLKDEDRPAMARLLEQILENQVEFKETQAELIESQAELKAQQAKILKHLDLDETANEAEGEP